MMRLAPRLDNELTVVHDLDIARRFLIRDGQAFQHYEMRDSPEYVWFQWCDYTGDLPVRKEGELTVNWAYSPAGPDSHRGHRASHKNSVPPCLRGNIHNAFRTLKFLR
jgi:hypothetical protein